MNTLRVGIISPILTTDPAQSVDTTSDMFVTEAYEAPFEPPLAIDNIAPCPRLTDGELRQEGPRAWSAAIRGDIAFSDGTPLTATDVARSLMRAADFTERASAEARGGRLHLALKAPNPNFGYILMQSYCGVVLDRGGRLLGSGPYMLPAGPQPKAGPWRLVRNPAWRGKAAIDEIVYTHYPPEADGTPRALLEAIRAGEVDFTKNLTAIAGSELVKQGVPVTSWATPGNSTGLLHIQTERPALADPRVRRAIAHAINRNQIAKHFFAFYMTFSAECLLPPFVQRAEDGSIYKDGLMHNPRQSEALFAEAGVEKPARLRLVIPGVPRPYLPGPRRAAETIAEQLRAIGIELEIVEATRSEDFFGRLHGGDFDLLLSGWIADTPDPADFFESLLASASIPHPGRATSTSFNISRWSNAQMDGLLARFRENPTRQLKADILAMVAAEVPVFPLVYGASVSVVAKRVHNFRPNPLGIPTFSKLVIR